MESRPGQRARQETLVDLDPIRRALQENEDWYRDLVDHSHDLLCIHDLQGRLLSINPPTARVLGYSVEELLQIPMREMIAPEFRSQFDAYLNQIATVGESRGLMAVLTRSGERRIWEYHNTLRTEGVTSPIVRGMAHDVTEQKKAEKALRLREADLHRAQAVAHIGSWRYEIAQRTLTLSSEAYRIMGLPAAFPLTPEAIRSVFHADDHDRVCRTWNDALKAGHYDLESRIVVSHDTRWIHTQADIEFDAQGHPLAAVGTLQDITEPKRASERLQEYERVVEGLAEMIVVVDRDYRYVIANHAFLTYRSLNREQVVGRLVAEVVGKDYFESVIKEKMDECFLGNLVRYEVKYSYPKLGERELFASYFPIEGPGGIDRVVCILEDITERKQSAEALRTSEDRLRVALAGSPIKMFNQDRALRYTWVYNLQEGWTEKDYLGKTDEEIFDPGDAAVMTELKRRVLETGEGAREEITITTHGTTYYCDLTVEPLRDATGAVAGVNCACVDVSHLNKITEELRLAKERLAEEKLYLEQEIISELGFEEIIGQSKSLKGVMEQVGKVASSDATVLLLGETGTGKELVARAIHRLSTRAGSSFIKMNCAAIPSGLLESELFGHEKGAFTGAVVRKIGRLELSNGGTLFLDEIGEIPLPLQPKLLRVLQDQEFERLGGTQTLKVDFRLIAATNRDLLQSMSLKEFRSDLYYRLNVFPVRVPPLRERREDIGLLVEYFVRRFSARLNRNITSIPKKTMDALMQWEWPGNVRELENFIERSVILTQGSVLAAPISELVVDHEFVPDNTLDAAEREHIVQALRASRGQQSGPRGAAARLGLPRSTLQSKLKKLGIDPQRYRE